MSSTHLASWYTTRVVGVVRVRNVTILIDLSIQVVDKVELAQNRKCVLHMAIHLMPIWHVVHYQRFDLQLSSRIGLDWIGLDWIGLDWIGLCNVRTARAITNAIVIGIIPCKLHCVAASTYSRWRSGKLCQLIVQ
jgi:hypothetical protein